MNSMTGFWLVLVKVSVVTTGGVILITRFAILSPKAAESLSSNRPSPKTGVEQIDRDKKTIVIRITRLDCNILNQVFEYRYITIKTGNHEMRTLVYFQFSDNYSLLDWLFFISVWIGIDD